MALDKLVDSTQLDSDLTSVANAIRTKGGTSAQLAFPAGFVSAINDISGGGGFSFDDVCTLAAPFGDVTFTLSSMTGDCKGRTGLTSVTAPNLSSFGDNKFQNCSSLTSVIADESTFIGASTFSGTKIVYSVYPKCVSLYTSSYQNDTSLLAADYGGTPTSSQGFLRQNAFLNCSKFGILVLRANAVWPLSNINNFNGSKFASGKAGGTLYVPNAMISSYQSATNWSTILGYTNNQIKSIESTHTDPDAPIDLTLYYADGRTIPTE